MVRPRRSALYLPGSNLRALEKAKTLTCDIVILDLEDAVAPDAKALAREQVRHVLANPETRQAFNNKELVVRINGLESQWYEDDLAAMSTVAPAAILLPKAESSGQVQKLAGDLESSGCDPSVRIWCMMETPKAILRCSSIAEAHPRLESLVLGTSDLTQDLHAQHTALRLPLLTSLGMCILAARAFGLSILDGVALDLADEEGFEASCVQGRQLGFDGKTLIHPKQIAPCNAAFSPSAAEVARAQSVVDTFTQAIAAGHAVAVLQGRLIEELHVREAERTLELHRAISTDR